MVKFKSFLKFLVSFLLMTVLVLLQISIFINYRFLNADFYKNTLNNSNYFQELKTSVDYGFKNYSMVTSVPEDIFTNSVGDKDIKDFAYKNIDSAITFMNHGNYKPEGNFNISRLNANIRTFVQNYAVKNRLVMDADMENKISDMSKDANNIVKNNVTLINIDAVSGYREFISFRNLIYLLKEGLLLFSIISVVLILLLYFLNGNIADTLLWTGSSFIPAALFTTVPAVLALIYKVSYRLLFEVPYIKTALQNITLGYTYFILSGGIILLASGVIFMLVYLKISSRELTSSELLMPQEQ